MSKMRETEVLLRGYKLNKERIIFLENQLKRLTPESHEDYIEYRMYEHGYSGASPMFVMENGIEVAKLNKVESTACEYRRKCETEYRDANKEMEKELKKLRFNTSIIEESIEVLNRINAKYKIIIESYYINNVRMEDVADSIHIGRSRCYVLCKEALKYMARVIFGSQAAV
ncbi:MAG: hypothetical protein N3I35_18200 [Clostridia bacterium]|nr:hypothetical protein [Clostridia bacterium]